jgi:hypothetical protein
MSKLLPDIYSYLKNVRRIVDVSGSEELVYRVSAYTGKEYIISKEILEITFEELINTMLDDYGLLFSFGILVINTETSKYTCKTHSKFKRFYGSRRKNKTNT